MVRVRFRKTLRRRRIEVTLSIYIVIKSGWCNLTENESDRPRKHSAATDETSFEVLNMIIVWYICFPRAEEEPVRKLL